MDPPSEVVRATPYKTGPRLTIRSLNELQPGPDGDPNPDRVELRIQHVSGYEVERALLTDIPIDYGTHFVLSSDDLAERVAICTSEGYAHRSQPGSLHVWHNEDRIGHSLT